MQINKARYFPGYARSADCYHEVMQKENSGRTRKQASAVVASNFIDHDLERAIPYLLARAGMRMGQAFTKELKPFGLSLTEWRVLLALHHQAPHRLAELGGHTSPEPSALLRGVEGLLE